MEVIVIGAGIAGSVIARELAERGKKEVLVIEKRKHIGGNCYDTYDEHGILVHQYGPHIFHTSKERVQEYLSRFTEWYSFRHEVVARVGGQLIPVPFNLNTLHMVFPKEADQIEQMLIMEYGEGARVPILTLQKNENPLIRKVASYVYENIFLKYTMKQWGQTPKEIDPAVTARVPVVISRDNGYFSDKYQGMPKHGYTKMFEQMLDHENIKVDLGVDAREHLRLEKGKIYFDGKLFEGDVIYTGAIDEFFDYQYGALPYRSLEFSFEYFEQPDFQGHSVVNYTVDEDYTRITEFKHLTGQQSEGTTIVKEYPRSYEQGKGLLPYYAINNEKNADLYEKYRQHAKEAEHFYLLGRLAEYKYYNIDGMAERALQLADQLI